MSILSKKQEIHGCGANVWGTCSEIGTVQQNYFCVFFCIFHCLLSFLSHSLHPLSPFLLSFLAGYLLLGAIVDSLSDGLQDPCLLLPQPELFSSTWVNLPQTYGIWQHWRGVTSVIRLQKIVASILLADFVSGWFCWGKAAMLVRTTWQSIEGGFWLPPSKKVRPSV